MLGFNYIDVVRRNVLETDELIYFVTLINFLLQDRFNRKYQRNLYFRLGTNYKLNDRSDLLFLIIMQILEAIVFF
jgi:hypothetical protein